MVVVVWGAYHQLHLVRSLLPFLSALATIIHVLNLKAVTHSTQGSSWKLSGSFRCCKKVAPHLLTGDGLPGVIPMVQSLYWLSNSFLGAIEGAVFDLSAPQKSWPHKPKGPSSLLCPIMIPKMNQEQIPVNTSSMPSLSGKNPTGCHFWQLVLINGIASPEAYQSPNLDIFQKHCNTFLFQKVFNKQN